MKVGDNLSTAAVLIFVFGVVTSLAQCVISSYCSQACVFRRIVGTHSGSSWAPIPGPLWAAIPVHRGHLLRCNVST
jgi:hypothetical protein